MTTKHKPCEICGGKTSNDSGSFCRACTEKRIAGAHKLKRSIVQTGLTETEQHREFVRRMREANR